MSETATMARPKKQPDKAPDGGKIVGVRVSVAYAAWIDRLAKHNRSSVSVLFDQAMSKYAKEIGFTEEAPER